MEINNRGRVRRRARERRTRRGSWRVASAEREVDTVAAAEEGSRGGLGRKIGLFRWAYRVSNIASCITGNGRAEKRGRASGRKPMSARYLHPLALPAAFVPSFPLPYRAARSTDTTMPYLYGRIYLPNPLCLCLSLSPSFSLILCPSLSFSPRGIET